MLACMNSAGSSNIRPRGMAVRFDLLIDGHRPVKPVANAAWCRTRYRCISANRLANVARIMSGT